MSCESLQTRCRFQPCGSAVLIPTFSNQCPTLPDCWFTRSMSIRRSLRHSGCRKAVSCHAFQAWFIMKPCRLAGRLKKYFLYCCDDGRLSVVSWATSGTNLPSLDSGDRRRHLGIVSWAGGYQSGGRAPRVPGPLLNVRYRCQEQEHCVHFTLHLSPLLK